MAEVPRYIVFLSTTLASGEDPIIEFFRFSDVDEANKFSEAAMMVNRRNQYRDQGWLLDLQDPDDFEDPEVWLMENLEDVAGDVMENPNITAEEIDALAPEVKQAVRLWMREEDTDLDERPWLRPLQQGGK